jgi:hypothetical protein
VACRYSATRSSVGNEMLGLRKASSSVRPNAINTDGGLYCSTDCDSVYRDELWLKVLLQRNSVS